ncbi:ECF-type sigma factor [Aquisphaera giovannonii]|uniref:ECF-type sigma factor n=1 Tax=Aquisphaera giovannonii TaxID=406548 RepID=UPI001FE83450|nr:ECF-type sigma factor [Aquisphaera giovannonii]
MRVGTRAEARAEGAGRVEDAEILAVPAVPVARVPPRGVVPLLGRLGDDQLRRIALDRMEGYTTDEIAERLGCARRTVARRLDLICQIWTREVA